jgi:hypothetical protein
MTRPCGGPKAENTSALVSEEKLRRLGNQRLLHSSELLASLRQIAHTGP